MNLVEEFELKHSFQWKQHKCNTNKNIEMNGVVAIEHMLSVQILFDNQAAEPSLLAWDSCESNFTELYDNSNWFGGSAVGYCGC